MFARRGAYFRELTVFQNCYQPPASPVPSLMMKKQGGAKYMRLVEGPPHEDDDGEEQQQEEHTGM